MLRISLPLALGLLIALLATPGRLQAHEFWIDADLWTAVPGQEITASLRVGQLFVGAGYSFNPQRFQRFDVVAGEQVQAVPGVIGDRPAFQMAFDEPGLKVVVHETTTTSLRYTEWEKFVAFVEHKDLSGTLEAHASRGLPDTGFVEAYSRHAKALLAVGDAAGSDQEIGLVTELVALANPYSDDVSGGVPVRLLYLGEVRPDSQIEVFERAEDGTVAVSLVRTDAQGVALVPVKPGHDYMLDAVLMRPTPVDQAEAGPVWESLWANLTFSVP